MFIFRIFKVIYQSNQITDQMKKETIIFLTNLNNVCISQVKSDPLRNLILIHLIGFKIDPFLRFFHSIGRAIHIDDM